MGKIRILEGTIQEVGLGSVVDGEDYAISFIKLNGERIRDIGCDKFLRSFIKKDASVKLSIAKGWFSHEILAIKLPDGEVLKGAPGNIQVSAFGFYIFWAFLLACGSYGLIYKGLWFVYFVWIFGASFFITRFFTGFRFKARHALDKEKPPALL
jgi:hypothetical protein